MLKPGRPSGGHSDVLPSPAPGSFRTGKARKLIGKARQFFGRFSPHLQEPDNDCSGALITDQKGSQPEPTLDEPSQLPQVDISVKAEVVPDQKDEATNAIINPKIDDIERAIDEAQQHGSNMALLPGVMNGVTNTATQGDNALQSIDNINSTYLQPFKVFNTVVTELANVHPYAKIALAGLASASQIILNQVNRDESVLKLLPKLREIYEFLIKDGELDRIRGMVDVLAPMSKQILECAQFVDKYSETKGFWTRLGKNVISETDATIGKYNEALDSLMQQFRDHAARDTVVQVHRIVEDLDRLGQDIRLDGMLYATGAGFITAKTCLDGTRLEILGEITDWIKNEDSQRVFWLSGVMGSGKSAIAHTIGRWLKEVGWLGSFFCFDRNPDGDRRHKQLFSTIARDLADCNVGLRHTVAEAVSTNASLKNTVDVVQQWQNFVLEPLSKSVTIGPVVIVIDALDESGSESTRKQILQVLRDELTKLPLNVRVFLTSRPLPDINEALHDKLHVRAKTMDSIGAASTERDILFYISDSLHPLHESFNEADFITLSKKADMLFEWARLACEFIRSRARGGYSPKDRFEILVTSSDSEDGSLLDHIYTTILNEAIHHSPKARARFQSTMRQLLGTLEPLPMKSLNSMRQLFPKDEDQFGVELVLESLASLLSGITDQSIPVRPLHASFHDFLTDQSRSGEFFVDLMKNETHRVLAFAALGVMTQELRFNICGLENSYQRNIDVPDLPERIKNNISPHLSYACQFWAIHVHDATFDARLGAEICSFFGKEFLVYWFEALSLLGGIRDAHDALESGVSPIEGRDEYSATLAIARDAQRFIRVFAGPISQSAPHLYLSALPFAPKNSVFASSVASKLRRIPRVVVGRDEDWPSVQLLLRGHTGIVTSVAVSPDGKWIASGSHDMTIRIWDTETGLPVNYLRGHRHWVMSVGFFPDGEKIASGSRDGTIRIWGVRTGSQIGSPLERHQQCVNSVAISPNGKLIASGSEDKTIIIWDAETFSRIGGLEGHDQGVRSVAFSPDGTRIVSGSADHTIRVWDAATHQQVGSPSTGHSKPISSVAWSPNGRLIASGSYDWTIQLWDPDSQLGSALLGHQGQVTSVTFSFDSKNLVSGSHDQTVRVWDVASRLQIGSPLAEQTFWVSSVAISRDASRIISGSWDRTVRVWDMNSTSTLGSDLSGRLSPILSVTFLEGTGQVISGSRNGTIQIWDVLTGMPVGNPLDVQSTWVTAVAFLAARQWAVVALDEVFIQVWSLETRSQVGDTLRGHDAIIHSVAISEDGKTIASGLEDGTIRLWSTETWSPIGEPCKGHTLLVTSVAFLPGSRMIVSGSHDQTVRLWEVDSGSPFGNPLAGHTDMVTCVASSHDSKYVASGATDYCFRLWDVGKGSCLGVLKGHTSWVYSVAFSPTGEHIISGSWDHTIRIWDSRTLSQVGSPLVGHTSLVNSVAFSPDGEWVVSGSHDGTVRIWNFSTALQLPGPIPPHASPSSISPPHAGMVAPHLHPLDSNDLRTPERCHIRFSPVLDHALRDSPSIIGIVDWVDPVNADDEGWVMGPNRSRILWIPVTLRRRLRHYGRSNTMTVPVADGLVELDLSEMAHGKTWQECWNP